MNIPVMDCIPIYKCLCDETRLRILNLLKEGPLCVCHVQEALQLPQSKISKQLGYLKNHKLLVSRRYNNWTIYEIPGKRNKLLEENLRCLRDLVFTQTQFKSDQARLAKIDTSIACAPVAGQGAVRSKSCC